MNKIFINVFILLFVLKESSPTNFISVKLSNYYENQINSLKNSENITRNFKNFHIKNKYYTTLEIGTSPQKIKAWIDFEEYSCYLLKDVCPLNNSKYDHENSLTFRKDSLYNSKFTYLDYGSAFFINEIIIINSTDNKRFLIENMPIIFMPSPSNDSKFLSIHKNIEFTNNSCLNLGFGYLNNKRHITKNCLLTLLKENKMIDYNLFFIFNDKIKNEKSLIIGNYPEKIFSDKYKIQKPKKSKIFIFNKNKSLWGLEIHVLVTDQRSNYNVGVAFKQNLNVIIGTNEYFEFINEIYFGEYISGNICKKEKVNEYIIINCDKNKFGLKDIIKFPQIKLMEFNFNYTFILDYEDLFLIEENNIIFKVVFYSKIKNYIWEFGGPFFDKYFFVLNFGQNEILFYEDLSRNKIVSNDLNDKNHTFIIIFLPIIICILCFCFGKKIYLNRIKKKMNAKELEQRFSSYKAIK